ncbi:MAG: mitochondrial fission ELM1 family protein [Alphaproteobacteria bacterium]|nr:mitochondrial fission ELM1 family protein [Alphaproteobacteria bacterium]
MNIPIVWVLDDGRPGTFNQALGVAEALGFPFAVKKVAYNKLAKLPNCLRGASLIGIAKETLAELAGQDLPDILITSGRRALPFARYIRKVSGGKTRLVQIMYPGKSGLKDFMLVAVPKHDNVKIKRKNVMQIIGAPHRVTAERLREEANHWLSRFADYPRPFTALIVGGSTKNRQFTAEMAKDLAWRVNELISANPGTVLLTTSRRTGKEQEEILLKEIAEPRYVYKWGDKGENPYFGFLALADRIIVTGDSVSMCSEACATPVPVYIYDNPELLTPKHKRFLDGLYEEGYAESLTGEEAEDEAPHLTLNPAEDIAKKVKKLYNKE